MARRSDFKTEGVLAESAGESLNANYRAYRQLYQGGREGNINTQGICAFLQVRPMVEALIADRSSALASEKSCKFIASLDRTIR
jgi:hypothetical protein